MKFKSKTELAEHIGELVGEGYLEVIWFTDSDGQTIHSEKRYRINYDAVKK